MKNATHCPISLSDNAAAYYSAYSDLIEVVDFPSQIKTVFGQSIDIIESAIWTDKIKFEHIGYTVLSISWGGSLHQNPILEWLIRHWAIERMQIRIDQTPIKAVVDTMLAFMPRQDCPSAFAKEMFSWILPRIVKDVNHGPGYIAIALRLFYRWCVEEGIPGFTELQQFELDRVRSRKYNPNYVAMRDPSFGPLTRVELSIIEQAICNCSDVSTAHKALYFLCRDWGLRPTQLALLKIIDIGEDDVGPYIMVPSIKGIRRSKLRRAECNLVKRYVADDTALALQRQCESSKAMCVNLRTLSENGDHSEVQPQDFPLFPSLKKTPERLDRLISNRSTRTFAYHADGTSISRSIRSLTYILNIPSPRISSDDMGIERMEITAYRFRRTKGTSMVVAGCSAEEVAEALDHDGLQSVSHYFRYNLDLHNFINDAHARSPEINAAKSIWESKFSDQLDTKGLLSISSLGLCALGAPCPAHPTVSCYACPSFRPDRNADHIAALANIESYKALIATSSTGPIAQQMEAAINGARTVIIALGLEQP